MFTPIIINFAWQEKKWFKPLFEFEDSPHPKKAKKDPPKNQKAKQEVRTVILKPCLILKLGSLITQVLYKTQLNNLVHQSCDWSSFEIDDPFFVHFCHSL